MEMMSPLDALFRDVEDAVTRSDTHMHIGSVGIFEGPAPGRGRCSRRLPPVCLWSLDNHVRRTALPAPGGDEELRNLGGRVMSQQLDRAKPLREMWVAEGLDARRWAVISKVHHCASKPNGAGVDDVLALVDGAQPRGSGRGLDLVHPRV